MALTFGVNGEWHTITAHDAEFKGIGLNTTLVGAFGSLV
jgi:hypothetical protein